MTPRRGTSGGTAVPGPGATGPRTPAGTAGDRAGGRLERWAAHPAGPLLLFGFAVLEGFLFPAPTEALQVALGVARPRRLWWLAGIATAGSVAGGLVGYTLGALYFERLGEPLLARYGLLDEVAGVGRTLREHLVPALLTSGYAPVPYQLYGITAGAFGIPLAPFVALTVVGRALKYALVGVLTRWMGPSLRELLARRPRTVLLLSVAAAVAAAAWFWVR